MPKPLNDDQTFSVYEGGYDPVAAVEGEGHPALPDHDGELNVGSLSDASSTDQEPPAEEDAVEDTGVQDPPADVDETDAADAEGDSDEKPDESEVDPDASETSPDADESELVPGIDQETARRELKEKTQKRIQSLAKDNKELTTQLDTFRQELDTLKKNQDKSGQSDTEMVAEAQEVAGLDLKPEDIRTMFDKALDGDLDTAVQSFTDMMQQVATNASKTASQETRRTLTQEQQQQALDKTAEQLSSDYSVLDPSSDDFNEPLAQEIVDLRDFYIGRGEPYAEALSKAAKTQLTAAGLWGQEDILNDAPAKATVDTEAAKVTRNQEAARAKAKTDQPPAPGGKAPTAKNPGKTIMDLSDAEFDALTDKELEKMTGTPYS